MPDLPLAGCGIAVTRPAAQAEALMDMIRAQGGNPIPFPLLEIVPLEDYTAFEHVISSLEDYNWAIFISTNAVEHGLPYVLKSGGWPDKLRCAGVGPATAKALAGFGITQVLVPAQRYDSEGLLALPEMQSMVGKRIVIFRGEGGRELIAETLRARGAQVVYAECYRRRNPQADAGDLPRLWQNNQLHAIIVTSSEALRSLLALADDGTANWLRATPLYANHPRIGELVRERGLQICIANGSDDEAMLQCLLIMQAARKHQGKTHE